MSKKPSLSAALKSVGKQPLEVVRPQKEESQNGEGSGKSRKAPSRQGKKIVGAYFDPAVSKQLHQIALDKETSLQDLMGEALNDFFEKYGKSPIA